MFFACYCALRTNVKVGQKCPHVMCSGHVSVQVCGYDNEHECAVCSVSAR